MVNYFKNKLLNQSFESNVALYSLSSIVTAGLSFLTTIILTFLIEPEEIGLIENFLAINSLVIIFLLFGSDTHMVKIYSEKNVNHFGIILNGLFIQSLIILTLLVLIGLIKESYIFIINVIFFTLFNSFYTIILTKYQLEKKALRYSLTITSFGLINFLTSVLLVYIYRNGEARIIGMTVSMTVIFLITAYRFNKQNPLRILKGLNIVNYKNFLGVGFFLFIGQLFSWIIEKSDRLLITQLESLESTGTYGIGYQFGMIMLVVQSSISKAWMPKIIENINNNHPNKINNDILRISIFLFLIFCVVSITSFLFITKLLSPNYKEAAIVSVLICFAYFIDGIWKLFNGVLIYYNHYKLSTLILLCAGFTNVLLNLFLIPNYGIFGASTSTLISFLIGLLLSIYITKFRIKHI